MAYVQRVKQYEINFRPEGVTEVVSLCVAVVISKRSIVTAGHCLCTSKANQVVDKVKGYRLVITCPNKGQNMNVNLNDAVRNKLNVRVGTTRLRKNQRITPEYNENIEAFLYKYDESPDVFSNNGDIGLIVVKNGLDTVKINEYRPICLPNFDQEQNGPPSTIEVKTAGWGKLYDEKETIDPKNPNGARITETSCHTNEARTNGDLSTPLPYHESLEFLDCVVYPRSPGSQKRSFCNTFLLKGLSTLSSTIHLSHVLGIPTPAQKPHPDALKRLKSKQDQLECETYMVRARIAWSKNWVDKMVAYREFDSQVDRIVIKDSQKKYVKRICYNLPKVAKYGVCTTKYSGSRNWGFCSRSCDVGDVTKQPEVYEEANFTLHENIGDSREAYFRKCCKVHVNYFPCFYLFLTRIQMRL